MDGILGGVDACQGDSGGPLWVEWDGRATQVEIQFLCGFCFGAVHRYDVIVFGGYHEPPHHHSSLFGYTLLITHMTYFGLSPPLPLQ